MVIRIFVTHRGIYGRLDWMVRGRIESVKTVFMKFKIHLRAC
ncbi:hypothetical protein VCHA29O39_10309 [Vibrio chagasii]|nr:hypothetical protein VCHA29O39_10309 [Vibrio chagasii]CAH6938142.1 hypothetical protein VCHA37O173_40126 [Vibrio chagasii]